MLAKKFKSKLFLTRINALVTLWKSIFLIEFFPSVFFGILENQHFSVSSNFNIIWNVKMLRMPLKNVCFRTKLAPALHTLYTANSSSWVAAHFTHPLNTFRFQKTSPFIQFNSIVYLWWKITQYFSQPCPQNFEDALVFQWLISHPY